MFVLGHWPFREPVTVVKGMGMWICGSANPWSQQAGVEGNQMTAEVGSLLKEKCGIVTRRRKNGFWAGRNNRCPFTLNIFNVLMF